MVSAREKSMMRRLLRQRQKRCLLPRHADIIADAGYHARCLRGDMLLVTRALRAQICSAPMRAFDAVITQESAR